MNLSTNSHCLGTSDTRFQMEIAKINFTYKNLMKLHKWLSHMGFGGMGFGWQVVIKHIFYIFTYKCPKMLFLVIFWCCLSAFYTVRVWQEPRNSTYSYTYCPWTRAVWYLISYTKVWYKSICNFGFGQYKNPIIRYGIPIICFFVFFCSAWQGG